MYRGPSVGDDGKTKLKNGVLISNPYWTITWHAINSVLKYYPLGWRTLSSLRLENLIDSWPNEVAEWGRKQWYRDELANRKQYGPTCEEVSPDVFITCDLEACVIISIRWTDYRKTLRIAAWLMLGTTAYGSKIWLNCSSQWKGRSREV